MKRFGIIASLCCTAAFGAPVEKLPDFQLEDQDSKLRVYRFPKDKVTVMTVADHKGSDQLAAWIQPLYDRYGTRIDIDGIADVSMIAKPFRPMFRRAFRKQLTRSVMLDWEGKIVKQFGYTKGVANLYVLDRQGRVVHRVSGKLNGDAFRSLIDRIEGQLPKATSKP